MYITWNMLMAVLAGFVAVCVGFSSICLAVSWCIKIIKGVKKPNDDINMKLSNDNRRIIDLEEATKELVKVQPMLLRSMYVILKHMRTNNSTGEIAKQEEAINEYLFNR